MKHGAFVNDLDAFGETPLAAMIRKKGDKRKKAKAVESILNGNEDAIKSKGKDYLSIAIMEDNLSLLKVFLNHGMPVGEIGEDGSLPIILATRMGRSDMVEELAQRGANLEDSESDEKTAFETAGSLEDGWKILRILLKNGCHFDGAIPNYFSAASYAECESWKLREKMNSNVLNQKKLETE